MRRDNPSKHTSLKVRGPSFDRTPFSGATYCNGWATTLRELSESRIISATRPSHRNKAGIERFHPGAQMLPTQPSCGTKRVPSAFEPHHSSPRYHHHRPPAVTFNQRAPQRLASRKERRRHFRAARPNPRLKRESALLIQTRVLSTIYLFVWFSFLYVSTLPRHRFQRFSLRKPSPSASPRSATWFPERTRRSVSTYGGPHGKLRGSVEDNLMSREPHVTFYKGAATRGRT